MPPSQELTIVIRARDAFSRVLTSATASFRGFFRSMATGAAAGAAFGAVVSGLRLLSEAGRSLLRTWEGNARAFAKVNSVLKSTGYASGYTSAMTEKLVLSLNKATGASHESLASTVALLAAQRNIKGDTLSRAATAAVDLAEGMRQSGSEAANVEGAARTLAMALTDPERGMLRLRRAGVLLTADQQAQVKAFARNGETAKAQALILGAVESAWGGAAAAANAATGGLATMRETVRELSVVLGDALFNSDSFRKGVEAVRDAADKLLASGAIELWAERVRTRIEALSPIVAFFTGLMGDLLDRTAELGAIVGGLAGGASIGDAIANRKDVAAESRQQATADLAAKRAALAAEVVAKDRAEIAAGNKAGAARRQARREELQRLAKGNDTSPPSASWTDSTADGMDDGEEDGVAGPMPTGKGGAGATAKAAQRAILEDLRIETVKGVAGKKSAAQADEVLYRLDMLAEEAKSRLTTAINDETAALDQLDAAQARDATISADQSDIDARAAALETLRGQVIALRNEYAKVAPNAVPEQGATEAMANSQEYLVKARESLNQPKEVPFWRKLFFRRNFATPQESTKPPTIPEIQAEARRLAEAAPQSEKKSKALEMRANRYAKAGVIAPKLQEAANQAAAEAKAIDEARATIALRVTASAEDKAKAEAAATRAAREQATQTERVAVATKMAAVAQEALTKATTEAVKAQKLTAIDRELRALARRDPLMMRGQATYASQAAEFADRKKIEKDNRAADAKDQARAERIQKSFRATGFMRNTDRDFLTGREQFKGAEKEAARIEDRKKELEKQKDLLQGEANKLLTEIRDNLKKNLEAS